MLKSTFIIFSLCCSTLIFSQEPNTAGFKLCDSIPVWPYYFPQLKYEGGFWEIKQHFKQTYPTEKFASLEKNSGIITIQFKVNCKGQVGDYKLLQCDLNYKPTTINKEITDYFLAQTKLLKKWIPAEDENGNVVNSHKFLSFKIKSGLLLEILPK